MAVRDKSISYMQVGCPLAKEKGYEFCYNCPYKSRCNVYALLMDLTAERHVCPLDPIMEKCVVDGEYLPHKRFYWEIDLSPFRGKERKQFFDLLDKLGIGPENPERITVKKVGFVKENE